MSLSFSYPTPLPSTTGWGPGYPDCQTAKIEPDSIFHGGVHRRIHPLVELLKAELDKRGYIFRDNWSWGFACRGTKDSSGNTGGTPSFHSWGLALDFNAPLNPFGAARENTQLGKDEFAWVHRLMHEYGFFWLGPAIGDWMHFSFCGSPADADAMLAKAKANGIGKPDTSYVVAGTRFRSLAKALARVKALLKKGKDAAVRVVRR